MTKTHKNLAPIDCHNVIINQAYVPHFTRRHKTTVTENDELSAARVGDASDTGDSFSAEIDSGVCEFSSTDVQVTCHVGSVVHFSHAEFLLRSIRVETVAGVDEVVYTFADMLGGRHAQAVEPLYE